MSVIVSRIYMFIMVIFATPCIDRHYYYYFLTLGSNSRGRKIRHYKMSNSKGHHPVVSRRQGRLHHINDGANAPWKK